MCGFAGFLGGLGDGKRGDRAELAAAARSMAQTLYHRGPDDEGVWTDPDHGLAFAFRRLAIIDLTPAGHQPMISADGSKTMVFNGEIYNAEELRQRLEPMDWRGHSDTEVLIEALNRWGVETTLARVDGMFALALWDAKTKTLTLARDRFGEKPLYWGRSNGVLLFGSELKALRRHPQFDATLDPSAIQAYLRWNWFPDPLTPFAAVRTVPPGHYLTIPADGGSGGERLTQYWSARAIATLAIPFTGSFGDAVDRVGDLLAKSVRRRLVSDVPVAVFLSGGIDSSLLGAFAAQAHPGLKSYSIAFDDAYLDESPFAAEAARHLGLDHQALPVRESDVLALVPGIAALLDAPLGDSAALPLALLAKLAGREVRVALSGDGADELFGGYGTQVTVADDWNRIQSIPGRKTLGRLLAMIPPAGLNKLARALGRAVGRKRQSLPGHRLAKEAQLLQAASPAAVAGIHRGLWRGLPPAVAGAHPVPTPWDDAYSLEDALAEAMLSDVTTYLPCDLCVKTDRATMAASLESRLPFLEPDLAALAWSLPSAFKIDRSGGKLTSKAVLRALAAKHIPASLVNRPKHGLEVPSGQWLRGALKDWAGDLLSPARLKAQGLIDPAPVELAWNDHQSGGKGWGNELWGLAVLQAWLDAPP